jgi:hypothetical protein
MKKCPVLDAVGCNQRIEPNRQRGGKAKKERGERLKKRGRKREEERDRKKEVERRREIWRN